MTPNFDARLLTLIQQANSVFITTHIQPDGDAIGSALGLCHALEGAGKQVIVACHDAPPRSLGFLPGIDKVLLPHMVEQSRFDLFISVDVPDIQRTGTAADLLGRADHSFQIDHHATGEPFAEFSYVDVRSAATGILIHRLLEALDLPVTQAVASCLYTAISMDTGNFCFGQMTDEIFRIMANLMQAGLPLNDHARRLHLTHSKGHMRLMGAALSRLTFLKDGTIACMYLTKEDFERHGALLEQSGGIVNHALYIEGVQMAFMATETESSVQFSLRCLPPHNVAAIAQKFGGGGHHLAAGCVMKDSLSSAMEKMRDAFLEAAQA